MTPYYNFWVNPWAGLVVRGGAGFGIPFGNQSVNVLNARSTFLGNLAFGYYFTPHDMIPIAVITRWGGGGTSSSRTSLNPWSRRLTVGAASLGFLAVPALAPGCSPSQAAAATVIVSSYAVSGGGNAATGSSSDVAGLGLLIPAVHKSTW